MSNKNEMRSAFFAMPPQNQVEALYNLLTGLQEEDEKIRARVATLDKQRINMDGELRFIKGEIAGIARRKNGDQTLDTTGKINREWDRRMAFWMPIFKDVVKDTIRAIVFISIYMLAKQIVLAGHFP